jgi:hypothetical protein
MKFMTGQSGTVASFFSEYRCLPVYHINITPVVRTSGRNVGTFKHNGALADIGGFSDVRVNKRRDVYCRCALLTSEN